jgi:dihydrofolate reductase
LIVSLLAAVDENRGIGFQGGIPWRLPDDLKQFKALTMGHHLVMGRKTYESIHRPLPGRTIVIVTRNPDYQRDGCLTAHSLEEALELVRQRGETEVFVIGGGEIFEQAVELADRIYLTQVHVKAPADTFFPMLRPEEWGETGEVHHPADDRHEYPFTFKILHRRGFFALP